MSNNIIIMALVEGKTEEIFIKSMVTPYLADKRIFMTPVIVSKPGQKGGDVKFDRVKNDIGIHLKQRRDTFLTLFIDYYGLKGDWPGLADAKRQFTPHDKAKKINTATKDRVIELFGDCRADRRFLPFVAIHEFEALLFSDVQILADELGVRKSVIDKILKEGGEPENIDDSPDTAPSKRLEQLAKRFKKTSTGIAIAQAIGLNKMRAKGPLFDTWLNEIEMLIA